MLQTSLERIHVDLTSEPPVVHMGDTSITPYELVEELDNGTSSQALIAAYPQLTEQDVAQAQVFVRLMRAPQPH